MQMNLRPTRFSARRLAVLATTIVVGVMTSGASSQTQNPPFPTQPVCSAPPSPGTDGWPVAGPDSLGSTPGIPVTFDAASLLSNDRGVGIAVAGVDQFSTNGGRITGTGPYIYTPAPTFLGTDTFSYAVTDASAQTTIGIIRPLVSYIVEL